VGWLRRMQLRTVLASRPVQALALVWLLAALAGGFWRVGVGERAIVSGSGRWRGRRGSPASYSRRR